jgi:hypothetical protein
MRPHELWGALKIRRIQSSFSVKVFSEKFPPLPEGTRQ